METMETDARKNRLKWACRRGMLELDLVLLAFLEQRYDLLPCEQKNDFERLLSCTDPELENWLLRNTPSEDSFKEIVSAIRLSL